MAQDTADSAYCVKRGQSVGMVELVVFARIGL